MADVLEQAEVDALLAAFSAEGEGGDASGLAFLAADTDTVETRSYDFKRPERVSKDQIRALEAIHEGFARNFGASLSAFLRSIVEVRVASVEQLTYSEFIHSLPNPTCFNLLQAPPLEGQMCLELSPLIVYPLIDRLLGGASAETFIPQRALTDIELRLVRRITDRLLANLTEAWAGLVDVKFQLTETESNPHLVQIVAPNEVVVVISFELKAGQRAGTMTLCIPFNVIEPVIGKLATQSWLGYRRRAATSDERERILARLRGGELELQTVLAQTRVRLGDIAGLRPGDVLRTDKPTDSPVILEIEARPKFLARFGRFRGQRAVQILSPIPQPAPTTPAAHPTPAPAAPAPGNRAAAASAKPTG